MDAIDAVLYINLEHRVDRNEHIQEELRRAGVPGDKIVRINATLRLNGAMGCTMSHIKALEYVLKHPEWNHILVLEDDFQFRSLPAASISALMGIDPEMDVGLLSYNPASFESVPTTHPLVHRVMCAHTISSYIVRQGYVPVLLRNFRDGLLLMEQNGLSSANCLDVYWTQLQPLGRWYALVPALGYQMESFSDIQKRDVAYNC